MKKAKSPRRKPASANGSEPRTTGSRAISSATGPGPCATGSASAAPTFPRSWLLHVSRRPVRYALYAALILAAIGLRFYLTGPSIPLPDLTDADPALVEAIENARAAVWQDPRSAENWGELGMLLYANHYKPQGVQCFDQAAHYDPDNWKWPYLKSRALEHDAPEAAFVALRRAAELSRGESELPQLVLAEKLAERGAFDEAQAAYRAVLEQGPKHARAHLGLGRLLLQRDQPEAALDALTHAAQSGYTRKAAHELLAQVYRRLGDVAASDEALAKAALLPPDEEWPDPVRAELHAHRVGKDATIARITELRRQGREQEVAQHAARAYELYPELYLLVNGRELLSQGEAAEAERSLQKALLLDPKSVDIVLSLGDALNAQEDLAAAEEMYRRAIELEPTSGEAHLRLGRVLLAQEHSQNALAAFQSAVRYMPRSKEAHLELAAVLEKLGRSEEAGEQRKIADQLPQP